MAPKAVVAAYVRRVKRGTINLDDVPESARRQVEDELVKNEQ